MSRWCKISLWALHCGVLLMSNKPEPLTEADSSFTNKQSAETVGSSPHTFPHINTLLSGVPSHTAQVFPQLVTYKI